MFLSEPLVSTPNTWEPAALAGLCGAENVTGWAQREAERLPLAASRSESRTGAMEKREKKKPALRAGRSRKSSEIRAQN